MVDPRVSLIVEWDNARYREIERAQRMLRRVRGQITEQGEPVEVLVLYNDLEVSAAVVKEAVHEISCDLPPGVDIQTISAPGSRYYQLKNEGARRSRGSLLVFVDSDVLPEVGWLRALLASFDDPKVQIAIANAYVDTDTLYAKIFALCWYFPLRRPDGPLTPTTSSFVNSFAVRRSTFMKHPFPEDREIYIGQCLNHIQDLQANGISIFLNPQARVAHPPPTFWRSAIINGHDAVIRAARDGDRLSNCFRASYWRWRATLGPACQRILTHYREVDLPRPALPIALLTATAYYSILCLAELLTRANRGLVRKLYAP